MSPVSYLLDVYVRCRWGHVEGLDFWLLGWSSLGSGPADGPPYGRSGTQKRHQQNHYGQYTAPCCSHPLNIERLVQMGLKCCLFQRLFHLTMSELLHQPYSLRLSALSWSCLLYSISNMDCSNCTKRQNP